jgi:hypothetical protein
MLHSTSFLAITKRTADLCATQSVLYAAGMGLIAATNVAAAHSVLKSVQVQGVIVCKHSWTEQEREGILAQLAANYPNITAIVRCVGCTQCDVSSNRPGTLDDKLPLTQLIDSTT